MRNENIFVLFTSIYFFLGCSNFNISKESLVTQLKDNQEVHKSLNNVFLYTGAISGLFLNSSYNSNGINKILCQSEDGKMVFLYPDKNTQLEITRISNKEVEKIYFDTAFLINTKIVGLRSRLIRDWVIEIQLDDIEKVSIYAEFAKTETAK